MTINHRPRGVVFLGICAVTLFGGAALAQDTVSADATSTASTARPATVRI
jgi:hypothetical protein